jgi:membrane associated rhomboid family serine protease
MLPIRDDIPSRRFPAATLWLIGLNVLVFLWELGLGWQLPEALLFLGLVPVRYTAPDLAPQFTWGEQALPFLTSMFLHGGWAHLLGNAWTLWVFGNSVEDRLGRLRYLALYFFGGLAAALLHIFTNVGSVVPAIGASGAIAAVMGAYFRLYPHARIRLVIPPFFLGPYFVLPAVMFIGWWFILQFFNGTLSLLGDAVQADGVAWWAHVGGFIFGAMLSSVVMVPRLPRRHCEDGDQPWRAAACRTHY